MSSESSTDEITPIPDIETITETHSKAYIYKITNTINNKIYIGETTKKDPIQRWYGHLRAINQGKGCPLLRTAIQKHGKENFTFEVIRECSTEERYDLEKQMIAEYNSLVPNGYNAIEGGIGGGFKGKKHSEETKKKMSKATRDMHANMSSELKKEISRKISINNEKYKGNSRLISDELKEKLRQRIRNLRLGKKMSEETRAKISNSLKTMNPTLKEETRKKISESVKRSYENGRDRTFSDARKETLSKVMTETRGVKISQYSLDGTFIKSYPSIKIACDEVGTTSIWKAVNGKSKTSGGFIWKRESFETASETDI